MSGIFGTMNVAASGMRAMQESVNTAANNIANSETEGYARKRVNLVTNVPQYFTGVGEISTGVRLDSVTRIRDAFIDRQVRLETGRYESRAAETEVYGKLVTIFREPSDTGINKSLSEMWNAWQELSKTPESVTARTVVLEQATTLADRLNHAAAQLDNGKFEILSQLTQNSFELNSRIQQIKVVDKQIMEAVNRDFIPNDLMDRRDLLIDQLSKLVPLTVKDHKDGGISLTLDGAELVRKPADQVFSVIQSISEMVDENGVSTGLTQITLNSVTDSTSRVMITRPSAELVPLSEWKVGSFIMTSAGAELATAAMTTVEISAGQIKGQQNSLVEIEHFGKRLDSMASGIALLVNTVHSNGEPDGIAFFTSNGADSAITAGSIQVNGILKADVNKILAGKTPESAVGDGSRALAIARLRETRFDVAGGAIGIYQADTMRFSTHEGDTVDSFYKASIAQLGISSKHSQNMMENGEMLLNQLQQRKESIMGVSVDEEISSLIKFQNGYQANARVMSTLVTMLDTLIGMAR
ncbi:MAG: flagellar hook-associated protein FlgK [Erysipelotrichaceae bacterium]|nr:flagellar hook-associated protein FlgK [Erysipelotrichaceae bacterium]